MLSRLSKRIILCRLHHTLCFAQRVNILYSVEFGLYFEYTRRILSEFAVKTFQYCPHPFAVLSIFNTFLFSLVQKKKRGGLSISGFVC